jgi:cation:H+ antiporter
MTAVLLMGLIARERRGPAGIGVESLLLLAIYAAAVLGQGWAA